MVNGPARDRAGPVDVAFHATHNASRGGHAPGHIRDLFIEWVDALRRVTRRADPRFTRPLGVAVNVATQGRAQRANVRPSPLSACLQRNRCTLTSPIDRDAASKPRRAHSHPCGYGHVTRRGRFPGRRGTSWNGSSNSRSVAGGRRTCGARSQRVRRSGGCSAEWRAREMRRAARWQATRRCGRSPIGRLTALCWNIGFTAQPGGKARWHQMVGVGRGGSRLGTVCSRSARTAHSSVMRRIPRWRVNHAHAHWSMTRMRLRKPIR